MTLVHVRPSLNTVRLHARTHITQPPQQHRLAIIRTRPDVKRDPSDWHTLRESTFEEGPYLVGACAVLAVELDPRGWVGCVYSQERSAALRGPERLIRIGEKGRFGSYTTRGGSTSNRKVINPAYAAFINLRFFVLYSPPRAPPPAGRRPPLVHQHPSRPPSTSISTLSMPRNSCDRRLGGGPHATG